MSLARQVRPAPPADFPVYGLDGTWHGARWLESFGDATGDPVRWVSLGHQGLDGTSAILVETHSRAHADALAGSSEWPPLRHVAHRAAVTLINITLPAPSLSRPDGMLRALVYQADERAAGYAQWPTVRWRVAGDTVTAHVWRFGGGWAAVSDAVDEVYLAVACVGADPDGLPLALIADGGAYHFRLDEPLHPGVLAGSRAARTGGDELPWPRSLRWHEDQSRVLRERALTQRARSAFLPPW